MQATIIYTVFESQPLEVVTVSARDLGLQEDSLPTTWLERIFREMNCVEGNELCMRLGVRSMSVGDLVRFKEHGQTVATYRCEPAGWRQFHDKAP